MTFVQFMSTGLLPPECEDERILAWLKVCWDVAHAQGYEERRIGENRYASR